MKNLGIIIVATSLLAACNAQKTATPVKTDGSDSITSSIAGEGQDETKSANPTKTAVLNNPATEYNGTDKSNPTTSKGDSQTNDLNGVPACINKLIVQFTKDDVQNPPRKIYSYTYTGKTVYYVTAPCCDFFTDLYDKNCNLIAHPDGGITGRGDGRAKDFLEVRTNEKLVWEDKRKSK